MASLVVMVDTSALVGMTRDAAAGLGTAGRQLVPDVDRMVSEAFDAQGQRGDQPQWDRTTLVAFASRETQAGKPAAVVSSEYHNGNWKTMHDTGTLRSSWRATAAQAGDVVTVEASPSAPYAPQVHAGGLATIDGRSVTLPPRLVSLAETDADLMERAIADAIVGALGG